MFFRFSGCQYFLSLSLSLIVAFHVQFIYATNAHYSKVHPELLGCISTLSVCNNGGCKLLCSNGHLDRSRCPRSGSVSFDDDLSGLLDQLSGMTYPKTSDRPHSIQTFTMRLKTHLCKQHFE